MVATPLPFLTFKTEVKEFSLLRYERKVWVQLSIDA